MRYIAHRCNIDRPHQRWAENTMDGVRACVELGLDVELDVRLINGEGWLGHDEPTEQFHPADFVTYFDYIWFHCKNLEALKYFGAGCGFHAFWHEGDQFTMTTNGFIFTRPGGELTPVSIAVMPEMADYTPEELASCYAICTDKWDYYRKLVDGCK